MKCLIHSKSSCRMAQLFHFIVLFHSVFGVTSLLYRLPPAYLSSPVSAAYKTSEWITSAVKMTSKNSPSNEVTLLYQILTQETSIRIELEKTVRTITKELEELKKNQVNIKTEQDILINNTVSLQNENKQMKDELSILKRRVMSNSVSSSESLLCQCDISNFTKELQSFKREVRYISLTFLDLQNTRSIDNASIYRFMNETFGAITKDVFDIQTRLTNMSTAMEREKSKQESIVANANISKDINGRKYCIFLFSDGGISQELTVFAITTFFSAPKIVIKEK